MIESCVITHLSRTGSSQVLGFEFGFSSAVKMNFLGFGKVGESHQTSHSNPAAVIPIQDDGNDEEGYASANDYLSSEPEDGEELCSQELGSSAHKSGSFLKKPRLPTLTEPLRLERKGSLKKGGGVSLVGAVLELLKGIRPGADLTRLQLPPHFNLPKSQLQVYGEAVYCCGQDYLGMCAQGASPVERLLAVVRFHLSTTRPAPFLKAPFNPILGETHHVSVGDLNVICEQV